MSVGSSQLRFQIVILYKLRAKTRVTLNMKQNHPCLATDHYISIFSIHVHNSLDCF